MDQVVKREWIDALRSGAYRQGRRALHTVIDQQDEFCCLGVLCDLAFQAGVISRELNGGIYMYGDQGAELPLEVQQWAGLEHADPPVEHAEHDAQIVSRWAASDNTLAYLNDTGYDFGTIASLIEDQL